MTRLILISILICGQTLLLSACTQQPRSSSTEQIAGDVSCTNLSEGRIRRPSNEIENKQQRTLLLHCVVDGYLMAINADVEIITDKSAVEYNQLGEALEKNNIWFYTEDTTGKQMAGLNIYNTKYDSVTWVTVGFAPSQCKNMKDSELVMRLKLSEPLLGKDESVLLWGMPPEVELANGCLNILAAGNDAGKHQFSSMNDDDATVPENIPPFNVLAVCILLASKTYELPPAIMLGIHGVRQGKSGKEYGPLSDGSYDLGAMKINSSRLADLAARWKVEEVTARKWLRDDPCTNIGVAAWMLRTHFSETGNLPRAVAMYNEGTEEENLAFKNQVIEYMHNVGLINDEK